MVDWIAPITALVALYGAVLSTYTLISSRRDKRRRVKVELSAGFLATGPDLSAAMLLIKVSNPGHITVIIAHDRDAPNSSETPVNIDPAAGTCAQRVDTARGNLAPLAARFASASRHDVPATAAALRLGCANFAAPQRNRPGRCPAPQIEDSAALR